jgi:D-proline reductase (dithiol) PrdB
MTQEEAMRRIGEFLSTEPTLSAIPRDTSLGDLRVRHGGYDIRGAQADPNVAFPLQRLLELEAEGVIGELAPQAYSFVGACAQTRLLKHAGPKWVEALQGQQVDAALLVPV